MHNAAGEGAAPRLVFELLALRLTQQPGTMQALSAKTAIATGLTAKVSKGVFRPLEQLQQ